jgi:hypothetical protein
MRKDVYFSELIHKYVKSNMYGREGCAIAQVVLIEGLRFSAK